MLRRRIVVLLISILTWVGHELRRMLRMLRFIAHELREMIRGKEFDAVLLVFFAISAVILDVCGAVAVFVKKNPAGFMAFPFGTIFLIMGLLPLWRIFGPYLRLR